MQKFDISTFALHWSCSDVFPPLKVTAISNFEWPKTGKFTGKKNFFFQFLKNSNIYLPMSKLSFFQFFSDFLPQNRAKFDHFSLFFEFYQSLFMHFSDAEIPIVHQLEMQNLLLLMS